MNDEVEIDEAQPEDPQLPAPPELVHKHGSKGNPMPEWVKEKLRRPRKTNSYPVPGESAADKGLDMTGFTKMYKDLKRVKITDQLKADYCDRLMVHGKKMIAAVEVGLHYTTISNHIKADPQFAEDVAHALQVRSQGIVDRLETDALEGHTKLTYDKETGALIAEEVKFETPLRMAMLRRHDPEYVERKEVEVTHRGGVLVVPGRLTMDSWRELFEAKNDPTQPAEEE